MNERHRSRRLQFGLRKLLLWTAVVALLLGMATTLGIEESLGLACWIIVVGVIRAAFGPKVAGALSIAAGMILTASFSYLVSISHHPGPSRVEATLTGLILGACFGLAMFGIVEGVVRAVDWADNLMRTKTHRD